MVKITLLNCIVMSLFITAMTTYFFDDIVYLELVRFFVLLFGFLCVGINITISIFFISKLCLLVSTQVHACVCVCAYTDTYIAFIMQYTQTYILYLTSCTYYIKYCVIIISIILHS